MTARAVSAAERRGRAMFVQVQVGRPDSLAVREFERALRPYWTPPAGYESHIVCEMLTRVEAAMLTYVPSGELALVDAEDVEHWAGWQGEPGRFFAAFADRFAADDEQRPLLEWSERYGRLVEARRSDADRQRRYRERKRRETQAVEAQAAAAEQPSVAETQVLALPAPALKVDKVKVPDQPQLPLMTVEPKAAARKVALSPTGKFPHLDRATRDAAYELWRRCVDPGVEYGFLIKELGRATAPPLTVGPEQLLDAIEAFAEVRDAQNDRERSFWTLRRFTGELGRWVKLGAMPVMDAAGAVTERGRLGLYAVLAKPAVRQGVA